MAKKKSKKKRRQYFDPAAQSGAAREVIDRYGSAEKGHFVAYSGKDNESGKTLKRNLKGINQSKVNPEYAKQNLKQQSGYAAEVKRTARQNAKKIISKEPETVIRTDDIGRVNDPQYDLVLLDKKGVIISGSGEQMKFVGGNPKECLSQLMSKDFERYLDAEAKLTVPSDFFNDIKKEADKKIVFLRKQLEHAQKTGREDLQENYRRRIDRCSKIKELLTNSEVSNKEALEARLHPWLSTTKDVTKISHRAGIEQAKLGAAVAGGLSLIRNVVAVIQEEKKPEDAALDLLADSGSGAVAGYATAFAGSMIKGGLQNSKRFFLRSLSETNAPATIVTSSIDIGMTMKSFIRGEINGVQCLEQIGEKGVCNIFSSIFATAGEILIPIPVAGALVGSMAGYALCSAFFQEFTQTLNDEKLSLEQRRAIETECAEAIAMMDSYRAEMEQFFAQYLESQQAAFSQALEKIDEALNVGDIDSLIAGANIISTKLNHTPLFLCFTDFDTLMPSNKNFEI